MSDQHASILVVDLEATCWDSATPEGQRQSIHHMEIIEIGCALANRSGAVLDEHSFMVRPQRHPVLSAFCTELTHITQGMVDNAQTLPSVVGQMNDWLDGAEPDLLWCSWGNYDRNHLAAQCALDNVDSRLLHLPHLNLKRLWRLTTKQRKKTSLASAMAFHELTFNGQPHRGIDDARNIARLLPFMNWTLADELVSKPTVLSLTD